MMEATMRCVAEKGMDTFSVAQAAAMAGINEALVYRDFGSRENLLMECYEQINHEICSLYQVPAQEAAKKNSGNLYDNWHAFFLCLLNNGYRTLFYQQFRDSRHKMTPEQRKKVQKHDIKLLFKQAWIEHGNSEQSASFVASYVVDGSVLFAKRILCGELEDTEEMYLKIWKMLDGGMKSLSEIQ